MSSIVYTRQVNFYNFFFLKRKEERERDKYTFYFNISEREREREEETTEGQVIIDVGAYTLTANFWYQLRGRRRKFPLRVVDRGNVKILFYP